MTLKEMVTESVRQLTVESGQQDVFHPELGWVVKDGKPTASLIAFFKKYERKMRKADQRSDNPKIPVA